ncbi:MAG: LLM class F420-dependent oxidoreductase [Actinomycetota bacterium]|nr:LLM class F420-dependent oxidoreductase [Actinomycetota bacterium]
MRYGAVFPQAEIDRFDPDEVVAFVQRVEEAGYDHLLVYDHVLGADAAARPGWRGFYDSDDPFLEPLVLFSYLARSCTLEFTTGVMILPQRQTALVAKQVATLEGLAPGRVRLGVGIGWNPVEYQALGVDFAERVARIEEQIPLLRRLWAEPTLTHAGRYDTIHAAGIHPRPAGTVPIWIGCGAHPKALSRVGRLADGWLPMPDIQPQNGLEEAWAAVRAAAGEAGRDPAALGLEGQIWVPPDRVAKVAERAAGWRHAGATAVVINPLRAGARWPDGHLDLLLQAADSLGLG